jgi:hypothetical protein
MGRFVLTLALLTEACGCARPDWIQSTLVTVDVSGTWVGTLTGGGASGVESAFPRGLAEAARVDE